MFNKRFSRIIALVFSILSVHCFIKDNLSRQAFSNLLMNNNDTSKRVHTRKSKVANALRMSSQNAPQMSEESAKDVQNHGGKDGRADICFIAGIGDTHGYGWGIAKELSKRNVKLIFGIWPPVYNIFMKNYEGGKFDKDMLINEKENKKMDILDIFPFDASFDTYDDIDEDTKNNKRYNSLQNYSIEEVANLIHRKYGNISMLVHSLANAREVQKNLIDTSRNGYLDALSKSSYSLISLCKHFCKFMKPQSSIISLTYHASQKVVPGYGGGMSSAKAALESDTRVLAYHLGRKYKIRINTISAGPLKSRAATAIKKMDQKNLNISGENGKENYSFIDYAIEYSEKYAPLRQKLYSTDVGAVASFLLSSDSRAVTGQTIYVDNGLNIMFGPDDLFQGEEG
ncbi:enoyl-acyl carrier reductase, putative [Plasmodium ovale]|uniref:Enoyl-acyl carrier reductase, putative n=2 Tax=Plasmodium ovale TaxID=36330 RepID=A0A1D3TJH9_PLAOA|nr:enoyl-acyl carrier reductase, putative (FABI) [Plasmodium ovale curtisi]SBS94747.1 enoyl-acyl carrier reductase, putative (FABI) [Plasmodium ovale curtisi]SCP05113.1 enoyl-acyl carrier reductase, putative [Plasmodium ovale]